MKALTTNGLTKLIQLIKSSFISNTDTVTTNTVSLADVATSGDFDDLINQPTIGNGTITFTQGGVSKGTITANQTGNSTIALDAGGTVDQTFDGTSANAQSGVAIEGELSTNYQSKLVSGTNIKTINNQSLLGSGNIDIQIGTVDQTFDGTSANAQSGIAINGELGNFVQKEDVNVWTPRVKDTNLGNYNVWRALAYDGTKFVALGYDGYISTSTDGTTWTSIIQNTELGENYWNDLVYNGVSFIALGLHGYTSTSTDGITWTTAVQNTNLGDNNWESLTYDGTKFVALGRKGYISTSTDGITWTEAVQSVELGANTYLLWRTLVYDGTKFVALEQTGYISTSTDGITWTEAVRNTNLGLRTWWDLVYDGTKFLALSQNGYTSTSTDGITWTEAVRDTNLGSAQWMALTYSGTKFLALAQSGYVSTSSGFTHLLNIQNNLYIDFTNNNKFNLLDGSTGLIPDDRLSTNIARTSQIPDISGKQDTLVSGTNIKTINNTSLLGSGNISIPIVTVDQTFDGTSANAQSGVAISGAGFLKNTATGSNALTILGNVSSQSGAINIGYGSNGTGQDGVAIGQYASASNAMSIAVGSGASALGGSAIQIGAGTNSTANTLSVGLGNNNNYQLLDATGLIPDARLSNNIARTSDVKNSEITVYQGVTSKGSFTLNQSSSASLELDEGVNCENYRTPIPPKGFVNTSSDFVESNLECTVSYEPVIDPETDEPVIDPETGEPLVVLGDILYQGGNSSLYQYVNSQFVPYEGTPPETYTYVYPFSASAGLLYRHWVYVDYINTAYIREDYYTYGELTGDVTSLSTYDGNGKYVGTTEITVTVDGYGEASVEAVFTNEDSTITRTLSRSGGDIYSSSEDNYVIITSDGTTVANMGMKQGSLQPGENIRIDYTTNTISSYVNAIDSVNSTYSRPVTSRSVYYTLTGKEDAIGSEFTGDNIELRVELGHNLPEGYTEYSYIQCNNAYIDTGLHGTEKTRFELCGTFSYAVSTLNLFGDNTTSGSKLSLSSGYWYVGSRSCSVNFMTSYNDNTHLFIGNKYGYTHNSTGVAISDTVSSFTTAKTLLIMGVNNATTPTTYSGYFNLQYAKIYEDNVLVFYGVPAKKNYDNTVGLYDLVSKNFFTKAGGTGRFTTGGSLVPKRKMSIKKIPTMTYNSLQEKLTWS